MKIGTAWEEITPAKPLHILGQMHIRWGERKRDPLTVNAVVFDDGRQRVAIVSVDVCVLPNPLMARLRQAAVTASQIPVANIHINATHTHVAPVTVDGFAGDVDQGFLNRLEEAVGQAVRRAVEDLETVDVFAGHGHIEQMGWNRRGMRRDGSCHMYWGSWCENFTGLEGPRDGDVGVLFARKPTGEVKVVIPSFATHPNCLEGESLYSADIPGEVRRVLRGVLGENAGVVYLTAAAGNIGPSIMENNAANVQPWRDEAGLLRSGQYLGGEILKVIAGQVQPMPDPVLSNESTMLQIPMRPWDAGADLSGFQGGILEYFEQSRDKWLEMVRKGSPVKSPVSVLRIGDAAICFNAAELYSEFGLAIKKGSPARVTLIAQLADDYIGYIPTPEAIRHGGYSALSSTNTNLVPEAGWLIVEATRSLLGKAWQ